jgi:hypothetical protein
MTGELASPPRAAQLIDFRFKRKKSRTEIGIEVARIFC